MNRIAGIIVAVAALSFAASPALAKSKKRAKPAAPAAVAQVYSDGSVATSDPHAVVLNGKILGRDPDPRVRFEI